MQPMNVKKLLLSLPIVLYFLSACNEQKTQSKDDFIIAAGQMPQITKDGSENIHLVYGAGDSIMYTYSSDNGMSFSAPSLVALLPHLAASHTRGPQIAATINGLIITACTNTGNIF